MRALIALAVLSTSCTKLLGITDPTPAGGGDGGLDAFPDSSIDAPPPCTTPTAFKPDIVFDTGEPALGFALVDFDAGGVDDIAIATGDDVSIFHGNGTGNFGGDGQKIKIPTAADDLAVDDYDSDGDDDLALWTVGGSAVIVRRQNRALTPPVEAEQPLTGPFTAVERVLAGQLDGNLRSDLLVHDGNGSRVYTSNLGTPGTFGRDAALVGTGSDDLLQLRQVDNAQREDALFVNAGTVKLSLQTTAFGALSTIATGATGRGAILGKFDNDAFADLVIATAGGLVLYRQNTAQPGTFTMTGVISPLTGNALAAADVNGDGLEDIVVPTGFVLQCAPPATGGPGTFTQFEAANNAGQLVFRDLDGNAKLDLVRVDGNNLRVRLQ